MGFTTNLLSEFYQKSNVTGIDVSLDAIEYAKLNFPHCTFKAEAIESNKHLEEKYDLILAFEFYPFTRTRDLSTQSRFIRSFLKSLNTNGVLVILQRWDTENSISSNLQSIIANHKKYNFSLLEIPIKLVYKYFKNYHLSLYFQNYKILFKVH